MFGPHGSNAHIRISAYVYSAKKNSEAAPGVGKATDMVILTAGRVDVIDEKRIEKLAKVREKHLKEKPGHSELEGI